jgi:hypothetical protein
LYALLSGAPPFSGTTLVRVIMATINDPHKPLAELCPAVSKPTLELVEKCLRKKPEERYANGAELRDALKACNDSLLKTGGLPAGAAVVPMQAVINAAPQAAGTHSSTHVPSPAHPATASPAATKSPATVQPRAAQPLAAPPVSPVVPERRSFALRLLEWPVVLFSLGMIATIGFFQVAYPVLFLWLAAYMALTTVLGVIGAFMTRFSLGMLLHLGGNVLLMTGCSAVGLIGGANNSDEINIVTIIFFICTFYAGTSFVVFLALGLAKVFKH